MSCTKQTVEDPKQDDTKSSEGCHERTSWAGQLKGELLFISNGRLSSTISTGPDMSVSSSVKEGILSRTTMRMLWVAAVFCRRFSCQARSTFLQVMTFQFAKNHLSGLRGGWRNSMVLTQSSAGRSQECGAVIILSLVAWLSRLSSGASQGQWKYLLLSAQWE